jgi:hypothetical protein
MQFITLLDYLLLPFFLVAIYLGAYFIRNSYYPEGHPWRKYFFPGLSVKIVGAILIGLLYQYYYEGGDTANYFYHAQVINSSFSESASKWVNLILRIPPWYDGNYSEYISKMYWYESPSEYTVACIAAFFGIINFTTYLPIAVLFGALSFTGVWALFRTFAVKYPQYTRYLAWTCLFIPSTIMWGSGIFKDSLCMFGLGWMTYGAFRMLLSRDFSIKNIAITMISFLLVATIKIYILLAFLPAVTLWILFTYSHRIPSYASRLFVKGFVIVTCTFGFLFLSQRYAVELGKYSLKNVATTSYITSSYIVEVSSEGSSYSLGALDPSISGMLKKFPFAVNVALFRPYIWEVSKPLQILNALEALLFLWVTIKVLLSIGPKKAWKTINSDPTIQFCLIFTLIFAFAVGLSSGNFGALSRYRIPCLPFYATALVLIYYRHRPVSKNVLSLKL